MTQKQLFITLVAMMMALLAAACRTASAGTSTAPAAQIPEITIKADDFSFDALNQIEAGLIKISALLA